eukprot:161255-Pelagomonas_calceolata.AAC.1
MHDTHSTSTTDCATYAASHAPHNPRSPKQRLQAPLGSPWMEHKRQVKPFFCTAIAAYGKGNKRSRHSMVRSNTPSAQPLLRMVKAASAAATAWSGQTHPLHSQCCA